MAESTPPPEKLQLPTEEEVDSALDYVERMFKKFRDRLRNLRTKRSRARPYSVSAGAYASGYTRRGTASPVWRLNSALFERHRKIADFSFSVAAEGREVRSPAGDTTRGRSSRRRCGPRQVRATSGSTAPTNSTYPSACRRGAALRRRTDRRGPRRELAPCWRASSIAIAEILAHPVDGETVVELSLRHRLPAVVHLPRTGRAFGDRLHHLWDVEARLLRKMDAFGEALNEPAMQIWLTILVSWPAPGAPISVTMRAKASITGSAFAKVSASPPTMTVSTPFCAPAEPPETGASRKPKPFPWLLHEFAGNVCRCRRVVDEDGALAHALEGAALAERHRAQIIVVADAGEDEIGALGGLGRRRRSLAGRRTP